VGEVERIGGSLSLEHIAAAILHLRGIPSPLLSFVAGLGMLIYAVVQTVTGKVYLRSGDSIARAADPFYYWLAIGSCYLSAGFMFWIWFNEI
jgi:hypothetical protein